MPRRSLHGWLYRSSRHCRRRPLVAAARVMANRSGPTVSAATDHPRTKCGGTPATRSSVGSGLSAIVVDATHVYWSNFGGTIVKQTK